LGGWPKLKGTRPHFELHDEHPANQFQLGVADPVDSFAGWDEGVLMSENVNVQYVGFEVKGLVREYSFNVRLALNQTSKFTLTIGNESFASRRVRYQDAAEICSLRLHRELAAFGNYPPQTHYHISPKDLDDYRSSHSAKAAGYPYKQGS
jgi:hypothetical protein